MTLIREQFKNTVDQIQIRSMQLEATLAAIHGTVRHSLLAMVLVMALAMLLAACGAGSENTEAHLPITEVVGKAGLPSQSTNAKPSEKPLAIFYSGDGGWAPLVATISTHMADAGIPVVGISSQTYLWNEHKPEAIAKDVEMLVQQYGKKWQRSRFMLLGFSFGAALVPFIPDQLDPAVREQLVMGALISPLHSADFEFHIAGWFAGIANWLGLLDNGVPIAPQIATLEGLPMLCLYGSSESIQSLCTESGLKFSEVKEFKGDHHLGNDFSGAARFIIEAIEKLPDHSASKTR